MEPQPDSPLTPEQEDERRQELVEAADRHPNEQSARHDGVRLDMMRSIVTEPLLSSVQSAIKAGQPGKGFDVIVSLSEVFSAGPLKALEYVKQRAEKWNVCYRTS